MSTAAKSIEDVKDLELLAIRERRAVHDEDVCLPQEVAPDSSTKNLERRVPDDLTGLALSGGGIRAAAFSLGFIQAMCRAGRMKAFDYLSTVSGGGYAGCLFSSTVARRKNRINWKRNSEYNRLDFELNADGSQPDTVKRLALHGRMMGNFLRLMSRHLWGFLINMTFTISGIVAVASLLAYVMRIPWSRTMLPILSELGFKDDISVAFFFAFIAFIVWIVSHIFLYVARLLNRKVAPITQLTYLLLIASVILGGINILALGDIDIGELFSGRGSNDKIQTAVNQFVGWISFAISGAFATSLLPYLSPKRLMQSGGAGASRTESMIFRAASNGLVIGAPLIIYFFLVHENISRWNSDRVDSDLLTASHLNAVGLAAKLESQAASDHEIRMELAREMYNALTRRRYTRQQFVNSSVEFDEVLKDIQTANEKKRLTDNQYGLISRCCHWMADAIQLNERFGNRVDAIRQTRANNELVTRRFNQEIISNPSLFVDLLDIQMQRNRRIPALDLFMPTTNTGTANDLLASLGLPTGTPTPSKENGLKVALETLQNGNKQWNVRYGSHHAEFDELTEEKAKATYPDKTHLLAALLVLANEAVNQNPIVTPPDSSKEIDPKVAIGSPVLTGQFVTRLQVLLRDDDLRAKIQKKLEKLKLPANFDGEREKQEFADWNAKHASDVNDLNRQIRTNNWAILSAMYPAQIRPRDTVFAYTVNAQDQKHRLNIALWAALIFVGLGVATNLNNTSLHGVYRDQLAEIWLADPRIQLHELENACKNGAPFHLINGTVNRMGHRLDPDTEGKSRFTFSHRFCGTNKVGFRETKQYHGGDMRVADAMAISGGAVTSANAPSLLHQLILFLTNFRLGQWLPNTQTYKVDFYWPSPIRALIGLLSRPEQRSHLFISDGGHIDNTGLTPLLERRCRLMVYVDASFDPDYDFSDLLGVMHDGRAKYGVKFKPYDNGKELPVDKVLDRLRPSDEHHDQSESHFVAFEVDYPENEIDGTPEPPGILICCKLTVTGEEPIEIVEKARAKGAFPNHPTTDQFLPPDIFESYLMLGRHIGEQVDNYVESGNIDRFELPASWRGKDVLETSADPVAPSNQDADESSDEQAFREIERQLQGLVFDEQGIAKVTEILDQWCNDHLAPKLRQMSDGTSHEPVDTSIFEMVSNWARDDDRGIEAPLRLRTKFCVPLQNQVERYRDAIVRDVETKKGYRALLSVVGHSVRNVRKSIAMLSQKKGNGGGSDGAVETSTDS